MRSKQTRSGVRGAYDKNPPGQYQVGDTIPTSATGESDYKKRRMATLKRILKDNPKNWDFSQQNVDRRQVSGESVDPMTEDWQKKSGKNPEGGLNEKGRKSYERENPGSDLKRPSKKVGNKRRASFCARMKGMKKKLT